MNSKISFYNSYHSLLLLYFVSLDAPSLTWSTFSSYLKTKFLLQKKAFSIKHNTLLKSLFFLHTIISFSFTNRSTHTQNTFPYSASIQATPGNILGIFSTHRIPVLFTLTFTTPRITLFPISSIPSHPSNTISYFFNPLSFFGNTLNVAFVITGMTFISLQSKICTIFKCWQSISTLAIT